MVEDDARASSGVERFGRATRLQARKRSLVARSTSRGDVRTGRSLSAHLGTTNDASQIGGALRPWHRKLMTRPSVT